MAADRVIGDLEGEIEKEKTFVSRIDAFIQEVLAMEAAIGRQLEVQEVYEGVQGFVERMEEINGAVEAVEQARVEAAINLAEYLKRLAEMGNDIGFHLEARQEVEGLLLETTPP